MQCPNHYIEVPTEAIKPLLIHIDKCLPLCHKTKCYALTKNPFSRKFTHDWKEPSAYLGIYCKFKWKWLHSPFKLTKQWCNSLQYQWRVVKRFQKQQYSILITKSWEFGTLEISCYGAWKLDEFVRYCSYCNLVSRKDIPLFCNV